MEPHELVAVGDAAFIAPPRCATVTRRRLGFHGLAILLESGEDLGAVVDLQDAEHPRGDTGLGPARFEYDLDDVVTRVGSHELRHGVGGGLVLLKEVGLLEDLAARGAGEDVVAEREEEAVVIGGDVGFGARPGLPPAWRILEQRVGLREGDEGLLG